MRRLFFLFLLIALVLNALSLFLGGHDEIGGDEIAIIVALICLGVVVSIMALRGKVFTKEKGKFEFKKADGNNDKREN